jgi:PAS domain S-box-containing protein
MTDNRVNSSRAAESSKESAALRSAAKLAPRRPLYEQNPVMCFALDANFIIESASRYACSEIGYRLDELLGRPLLELAHASDWPQSSELLQSCVGQPGEIVQMESRKMRRDQSPLWVSERASAVRGDDGRIVVLVVWEDITERRQADGSISSQAVIQEIKERKHNNQAQLRTITNSASDAILMMDSGGKITFWNPAAETIFGYRREEAMGQNLHQLLAPQRYHEAQGRAMPEFARTGQGSAMGKTRELAAIRKDGEEIDVALSLSAISLDGKWHAIGILRDITERKRAELALQQSEEKFRQLAENIREVFFVLDPPCRKTIYVSPGYEQIWERSRGPLYGDTSAWVDAVHPEDRATVRKLAATRPEGVPVAQEYRILTPNGVEKWIRSRSFPVRDEAGQLTRIVGIAEEITERKRAELILQRSEERFRQLAENIREVFRIVPIASDETLYVSPAYEQIWGRSLESIYKNPESWRQAVHPDDRKQADHLAEKQLQNEDVEVEYRIHTPDGQEKWIRDRAFPVRDKAGRLTRVVGIAEEITEQKRYESELIHAREMAESANRAKSAFLATMSHELRTPLNAILGFAEFLELEMEDQKAESWLKDIRKIRKAGSHLLDLISDVMDLSKIEAGKMELAPSDFDAAAVVAEVGASAEPLAAKNQVRLHVQSEPVEVRADRLRFRQCLFNLASNACKFTKNGEVRIEQKICQREGRTWCMVRVADTGIGIRAEDLGKIFEDFTQVDGSISRKYGGTGLGLPITRRLMQMMGGDITVESVPGEGSTFTMWLPCEARSTETQPAQV